MTKIISAESICEGHPDKLCDLIADGILDACLMVDPFARCAVEVLATKGFIVVAGEVTCKDKIDYAQTTKSVLERVGYNPSEYKITVKIHTQSKDIDGGVTKDDGDIGAGDQGVVYGYACNETDEYLPLPVVLANRITRQVDVARHWKNAKGLLPDGKCLVGVEYENGKPKRIDSVVLSMQHDERVTNRKLKEFFDFVITPNVFTDVHMDYKTKIMVNPSGRFVIGGPEGDTGLTGRKLMCDTYGGIAHHGGGAFSGKDATKVDRSAAYYARYVAKNIVAAGLAEKCEVCITYAIGKAEPVSVQIDTFGTGALTVGEIERAVMKVFDFRPKAIIDQLKLRKPNFTLTTCYGHFGKPDLSYEQTDKVEALKEVIRNG